MNQLNSEEYQNWENQWSQSTIPVTQHMMEGTSMYSFPNEQKQNASDRYFGYDDPSGANGGSNTSSSGSGGTW